MPRVRPGKKPGKNWDSLIVEQFQLGTKPVMADVGELPLSICSIVSLVIRYIRGRSNT